MFAEVNGIRMCYEDRGAGEAIILIGGFGANRHFWDGSAALMEGFRVVTLDNRGVGETEYSGGFSLTDLSDDVVALMDHLDIPRAHVMGWSMGSQIAQLIALNHHDRVKSLTLVSSFRRLPSRFAYVAGGLNDMVLRGEAPMAALATVVNAFCFPESLFRRLDDEGVRMPVPEDPEGPEGLRDQLGAMEGCDTTDQVGGIRVPTLVVHGGKDIVVEPSEGLAVAAAIPGSRFLLLDSAGHSIATELYWGSLRAFVESNA